MLRTSILLGPHSAQLIHRLYNYTGPEKAVRTAFQGWSQIHHPDASIGEKQRLWEVVKPGLEREVVPLLQQELEKSLEARVIQPLFSEEKCEELSQKIETGERISPQDDNRIQLQWHTESPIITKDLLDKAKLLSEKYFNDLPHKNS